MCKLVLMPNTNQNGVIIQETHMIMVHSLISITEKLVHTQLLRRMFNSMLIMNQNGDTIVEILMIMVLLPISIMEKLAHIL